MRVLAVVVTYNPEIALLSQVLGSAAPQVHGLVVVDNGSTNAQDIRPLVAQIGAHFFANPANIGIAAAQNQGIDHALAGGFTHLLLMDQDTVLASGTVADLVENLSALEQENRSIAAIGPAYYELNSRKQTRAYRADGLRLSRISLAHGEHPVVSDFIIASGSLVPLSVIEKIGRFKEELFIDLVDVEWCFRAKAAGYESCLSPTAIVEHRLGSGTVHIGSRKVAVHVPVRNYYWVRNALWLARQPYTPLAWRLYFISRSLAFLATYTTLADKRGLRLQLMVRGIWDSLTSRLGPLRH